jgi:pimeloyl-ACP methyl ester carboxylesterase
MLCTTTVNSQVGVEYIKRRNMNDYEIIKTESRIAGLQIAVTHKEPAVMSTDHAVLFLHGSSFPSALSFGFKMDGYSWIDNMAENGYDVYALDFLGYGYSDRYPEMETNLPAGNPVGRAVDVCMDVDKAVDLIIKKTGKAKVYLIGHSWGASVSALYATRFPGKVSKLVLFAAITAKDDNTAGEKIEGAFESMTPDERVTAMKNLTPPKRNCQLAPEVFQIWGETWLHTDMLAAKFKSNRVRFPSGPSQDVQDLLHNNPYYDPAEIKAPVLVIRGEWDKYPDNTDGEKLFVSLENAPLKKYVVIEKGTHVMHLEKSRHQLYDETCRFLKSVVN